MHKLLVYGTLRKGHGNHGVIFGAKHIGDTAIKGTLYSLGAFPAVTLAGETKVKCECYEIDDVALARCDRLEGHPSFYKRVEVDSEFGKAWVYTQDHVPGVKRNKVIASGDWSNRS